MTIAGSGPSAKGYGHVDIATKKGTCTSDYVAARHSFFWYRWPRQGNEKLLVYNRTCDCMKCRDCQAPIDWDASHAIWDDYFLSFNPKPMNVHGVRKASLGALAVFMAVERWKPKTIGLIGFDWILDGNPDWAHDAQKERQAILSLTNIVDLRNDKFIRRIRPEGGVCLPHFLSIRN